MGNTRDLIAWPAESIRAGMDAKGRLRRRGRLIIRVVLWNTAASGAAWLSVGAVSGAIGPLGWGWPLAWLGGVQALVSVLLMVAATGYALGMDRRSRAVERGTEALEEIAGRYESIMTRLSDDLETEVVSRVRQAVASRQAVIFGLAKLADCRDSDTGEHLERLGGYSELLACELRGTFEEIDDEWIDRFRLAVVLHDVGKVGVPDSVLCKPGILTPKERSQMQQHTRIGGRALEEIRGRLGDDALLDMCIDVALQHHERWDGQGYPNRLGGEEITVAARIVAVADVYDALTSQRVYKPAMEHEEAKRIILEGAGTQFDPRVVGAFERAEGEFRALNFEMQPRVRAAA